MTESEKIINDIAEEIDNFVSFSSALELVAKEINLPYNASPLYNFRDALNHYRNMYENRDNLEIIKIENNSIQEHLFRGLKDIFIYINNNYKFKLQYHLDVVGPSYSFKKKNKYRKLIHKLKNIELDVRANSETACIRDLVPQIDALNTVIIDIKSALNDDQAIYVLTRRI